ncbi:hypothetical protein ABZY20_33505 [Streptomyces sp. NPDC006624]|uniref:hypothetical protein n=1 Tax=Streptomyces sp. NPDC006624 TaxID=3154892 RepID=UPI0033B5812D
MAHRIEPPVSVAGGATDTAPRGGAGAVPVRAAAGPAAPVEAARPGRVMTPVSRVCHDPLAGAGRVAAHSVGAFRDLPDGIGGGSALVPSAGAGPVLPRTAGREPLTLTPVGHRPPDGEAE